MTKEADEQYATPEMTDLPDMGHGPKPKDSTSTPTPASKVSNSKSNFAR
jgi:hypothetical protein